MARIVPKFPLYLKETKGRGWGVYCSRPIPKGRIFEVAPIIYLPRKFWKRIGDTPLESYRFTFWGRTSAIVLGYGSIYNHSRDGANCEWDLNPRRRVYFFRATKYIPAHTEICHDYRWAEEHYAVRGMPSRPLKKGRR